MLIEFINLMMRSRPAICYPPIVMRERVSVFVMFEKLKEAAAMRCESLTAVVNDTLRHGLGRIRSLRREPFSVTTFDSPFQPGIEPLCTSRLLDDLEVRWATDPSSRWS